jgi:dihydropyrimidinase
MQGCKVTRYDLVISGGQLADAWGTASADLGIADGKIAAIGTELDDAQERVDARGLLVLPGLIDPHVHPIHAENYRTVSEAAVFGGVTTVLHHLYLGSNEAPLAGLQAAVESAAGSSIIDYSFHLRLTDIRAMAPEIPAVIQCGVPSFKMFMAYGKRGIMIEDDALLEAMQHIRRAGGLALLHAEDGRLVDGLQRDAERRRRTQVADYAGTRPSWVEANAVARAARIAALTECPVYFVHTTSAEALAIQVRAKMDRVPLYTETCPQYLLLTDEAMAQHGARAKIAPPLRTKSDQEALWSAVRSGLVDAIGSDHSAFAPEAKEGLDDAIFQAGSGAPGIEHMLSLLYDRGVLAGRIPLTRLVELMSAGPARIFGLTTKGALRVGADADIVLFAPSAPFVIEAAKGHGRSYYSLYEGWAGRGSVQSVMQRGRFLVRDGEFTGAIGGGRFVARGAQLQPGALKVSHTPADDSLASDFRV